MITRRRLLFGGAGVVGAAGVAGTGTVAYAAAEARSLTVTDYRLTPPGWRAGQRLTLGVISDLHAGGPNMTLEHIRRIVETTNALGADIIVLLGDYFAHHKFLTEVVPFDACFAELARLRAPLGVWSILGNHDWWRDPKQTRAGIEAVGLPILENRAVPLGQGNDRFWLAGLGDQIAYPLGRGRFRGVDDLPGTLAQVSDSSPVILLAHEPDIFPEVPARVSLTLSGHTHGAQLRIPLIWPWLVPSAFKGRFAYGHIVEDGRHMIVSGGLGTSIVPLRLGVPPEVLRVTLG